MIRVLIFIVLACGVVAGQNTNSSTTTERPRTASPTNRSKPPVTEIQKPPTPAQKAPAQTPAGAEGVLAAFNALLDGIRHASVNEVMSVYWNSTQLNMFNYNGTVTKGWQQVRKNRESSYPEIKDVKLEVRDVSVTMLGRDGATVTCLWTQSQNYKGSPENVSGRMTLVFKRVGPAWKAIHLHSSPDNPNPAVIPASERPSPSPSPTP
ncbi:MAG TPA: nuclear transport factor 2 family protein [Pyrinomonadaceae bacterium]|nr:nuclear transport factor 2 family protein [Pyrinomonadaceae bacterium]